jgi:hypothetical protein
MTEPPARRRRLWTCGVVSDHADVLSFLALAAGSDVELDPLTLFERPVTGALDIGEVDEHVVTRLTRDEAVALFGVEELHGTGSQFLSLSVLRAGRLSPWSPYEPRRRTDNSSAPLAPVTEPPVVDQGRDAGLTAVRAAARLSGRAARVSTSTASGHGSAPARRWLAMAGVASEVVRSLASR